ncbi:SIS domain-containing protein [Treponema sp. OMZ 840]|uniref:SIS domain-containing protein n=1 Tax=Treponema sp. OMZ 840 TaxID=244313 RepID=UPI003D901457
MDIKKESIDIINEIAFCMEKIDTARLNLLLEKIKQARRVFFVGTGRSRIMLSAFCMRLNHLGIESYIAGNIPCPPAEKGDLIIAASGSGETPSVVAILKRLKKLDLDIFLFTASETIKEGDFASTVLKINAPSALINEQKNSKQLMRTLFEQTVFIIGETLIFCLTASMPEQEIVSRHTNLE